LLWLGSIINFCSILEKNRDALDSEIREMFSVIYKIIKVVEVTEMRRIENIECYKSDCLFKINEE